jgi:hypothetical protein
MQIDALVSGAKEKARDCSALSVLRDEELKKAQNPWQKLIIDLSLIVGALEYFEGEVRNELRSSEHGQADHHRGVDLWGRVKALHLLLDEVAKGSGESGSIKARAGVLIQGSLEAAGLVLPEFGKSAKLSAHTAVIDWVYKVLRSHQDGLVKGSILKEISSGES